VFAHGMLSFGAMARMLTDWAGQARLRDLGVRFVAVTHVHDTLTCSGRIAERFEADGGARLRVALEARTQDGRTTLVGEAIVDAD
jgi:acyl dehydratase